MRTIEREIVSALMYSKDGKIFVARATLQAVYPGCWKIPGGGVDEGESKLEAVCREIAEETGLDISSYTPELIVDDMSGEGEKTLKTGERVHVKMKFFTYKVVLDQNAEDITITLDPDEFEEYQWVKPAQIKDLKVSPPSVELYTRLGYL
jgi:8-oxo-dGTP pyrophosphatase MutT (NUDIX family)